LRDSDSFFENEMESDEERKVHRDTRLRFARRASSASQAIRYVATSYSSVCTGGGVVEAVLGAGGACGVGAEA
jgi:hypothetical protein